MTDYQSVADTVTEEIRTGGLRPGDRLPPLRDFALQRGIAASTAGRVYRELARRGLTVGEVGRGTFVRAAPDTASPAPADGGRSPVDMGLNYPVVPEQSDLLARGLGTMVRPGALDSALRPCGAAGTDSAREAAADLLVRGGWRPDPARVLFAGNGRQAIAAVLAALVPPGGRLGVEEVTYPAVKALAARVGATVVPLAVDGDGLVPEAVEQARRSGPLHAVYTQPTLHNPLSLTMPPQRRAALAEVVVRLGIPVLEDTVWAFLRDDVPPLAALAPEVTVLVDSLSKRIAPGLNLGYAVVPPALQADVAVALRSGGSLPMGFALEAASRWQRDGTVRALVLAKQRQAVERQEIARRELAGFTLRTEPHSYHCWWELPGSWRSDSFVAAAARQGIGVVPASAFAVAGHCAVNAVRIGLASPPARVLPRALATLARLARSAPDDLVGD
ncbi:PLP-dependent aminotransferase family protein [Streptomyces sp. NPDC094448]|uniref:aminotransferase-like domain-containing protein n=1 Tax=Streptomyces sp. NPDC094448 TaxID=3366063 RepID=UPI0037F2A836